MRARSASARSSASSASPGTSSIASPSPSQNGSLRTSAPSENRSRPSSVSVYSPALTRSRRTMRAKVPIAWRPSLVGSSCRPSFWATTPTTSPTCTVRSSATERSRPTGSVMTVPGNSTPVRSGRSGNGDVGARAPPRSRVLMAILLGPDGADGVRFFQARLWCRGAMRTRVAIPIKLNVRDRSSTPRDS